MAASFLTTNKGLRINFSMQLILSNDQDKILEISSSMMGLSSRQRLALASKKFGIFLVLAVASVFIPVFHFFLVPLFLFLAFFMGMKSYGTKSQLAVEQDVLCFSCQHSLRKTYNLNSEMRISCEKCSAQYLVKS